MNPRRTVQISLCLLLVAGPLVGLASSQESSLNGEPRGLLSAAEFPDYDAEVWRAQRNGLATKAESARLAREPESPEIAELLRQRREDEALRVMRTIVDKHPERIPRLFEVVGLNSVSLFSDEASDHPARLQGLVDDARKQLPRLSKEEAARAERNLLRLDRRRLAERPFEDPLMPFVQQYSGTEAARLTEIETLYRLPIRDRLQALDRIVRDHPGTTVAAQALWTKASGLAGANELDPRGADPTERFFQVLEIVRELESGRYPSGEWVERAPDLLTQFFSFKPTYAPGNIDRILDVYLQLVKTHFSLRDQYPSGFGSGYIVTSTIFELLKQKGEGLAGMERVFADLERSIPDVASVRYLRALFYVQNMRSATGTERSANYRTAIEGLARLQAQGRGLYHRKALATLASLYFEERDYPRAREAFRKYAASYPESAWSWVGALRIGQCEEALGNWKAAGDAYLAAASNNASIPLARVLGRAYAARSYEARGQIEEALRHYQAALAGWDDDYGTVYSLHLTHPEPTEELWFAPQVVRAGFPTTIARLKAAIETPGGAMLDYARWLVEHDRPAEALNAVERILNRFSQSPAVADARYAGRLARLGRALQLADIGNPRRNDAAALAQLSQITAVPYDFGVCAAKIARASILERTGAASEGESLMASALREWQEHQRAQLDVQAIGLDRDIADIRNLLLGRHGAVAQWGRSGNDEPPPPFEIVNPEISLKLFNEQQATRRSVYHPLSDAERIVFLNTEQQAVLKRVAAKLGGIPNPENGVVDLLEFWKKFYFAAAEPGMYLRREFESSVIEELVFVDRARTKAAAKIRVRNKGTTFLLEKVQGIWTARVSNRMWIA